MKKVIVLLSVLLMAGCTTISGIGEDNTPAPSKLVSYQAQFLPEKVWSNKIDATQSVATYDLSNGMIFWRSPLKQTIVAGPTIGNNLVVVGDNNGGVWALSLDNGHTVWHVMLSDPIVAPPIISNRSIFVKTLDGSVWALSSSDGSILWQSAHSVHTMVLSGGSKPLLVGSNVIVGSSNGTLTAYAAQTGAIKWQSTIARPQGPADVEKMVDIVAAPKISGNVVYVVTYQGNLAAVNAESGQIIWQTPLSSYTGLVVTSQAVFVTDAKGVVWAFNRKTGKEIWKQEYLKFRRLTAPAIMGNTLVVADGEGEVHWLSQSTGQTLARINVNSAPIESTPLVQGNVVYILSSNGLVSAYTA